MQGSPVPIVKDLVLVGGGHAHVTVLKRFGMEPIPGVRLTLICRDVHTPYSGMLPGYIAGHYSYDDIHIDLQKLGRFARARLIHDEVAGLDPETKRIRFRGRPDLSYDLLAINIGSTPAKSEVPGADEHATAVKPISRLVERWDRLIERVMEKQGRVRIGVVGAGAAGVEVLLAMQFRLDKLLGDAGCSDRPRFVLFGAAADPLPSHNARVRAKFRRVLAERGIECHLGRRVAEVDAAGVRTDDGAHHVLDEVLWTTQASAQDWPAQAGLATDRRGFIQVDDTLQSVSHPGIFATGDVSAMVNHPREKAGVFAVRQGPPLEGNLRRLLMGEEPVPFHPQKQFLSLVSTGDKYAVASRSFWSLEGEWVWRWKDRIDVDFMNKFSADLPEMGGSGSGIPVSLLADEGAKAAAASTMHCRGCGSKVGSDALRRALAKIRPATRSDVLIGVEQPDDASAVEVPPGKALVQTADFFGAIVDDPYVFGKIAAQHALGDIFAMGAEPQSALAIAVVPYATEDKTEETLTQLLSGANEVLSATGAALVGGHSNEGPEMALGFSLTGLCAKEALLRKGGMRVGDRLILTKPIGTGTLFAAEMRGRAKGRWIAGAVESMLASNQAAAGCLRRHGATALTDVTGFGLVGHLLEMCRASEIGAELELSEVPLLEGASETAAAGMLSTLQPQNLHNRRAIVNFEQAERLERYPLLFDPQTSGGLLASVPQDQAEACLAALREAGCSRAAIIGRAAAEPGIRISEGESS